MKWRLQVLLLLSVLATLSAGCVASAVTRKRDKGRLIFSSLLTVDAFTGKIDEKHGLEVYASPMYDGEEEIVLYRWSAGKLDSRIGLGNGSAKVFKELRAIDFKSFDFSLAVADADERIEEKTGQEFIFFVLDGFATEIVVSHDPGETFRAEVWNIGPYIDEYAEHSVEIDKLKRVVDLYARILGRCLIGT